MHLRVLIGLACGEHHSHAAVRNEASQTPVTLDLDGSSSVMLDGMNKFHVQVAAGQDASQTDIPWTMAAQIDRPRPQLHVIGCLMICPILEAPQQRSSHSACTASGSYTYGLQPVNLFAAPVSSDRGHVGDSCHAIDARTPRHLCPRSSASASISGPSLPSFRQSSPLPVNLDYCLYLLLFPLSSTRCHGRTQAPRVCRSRPTGARA